MKQIATFNQEQRKIIHKFTDQGPNTLSEFMVSVMNLINSYPEGSVIAKSEFSKRTGILSTRTNNLFTFLANNRVLMTSYMDNLGRYGVNRKYVKTKFKLTEEIMLDAIEKTGLPDLGGFPEQPKPKPKFGDDEVLYDLAKSFFGVTVYRESNTVMVRLKRLQTEIPECISSVFDFKFFSGDGIKYAYLQRASVEEAEKTIAVIKRILARYQQ